MRLNRKELRRMIVNELSKSIDEETLLSKNDYKSYGMLNRHNDPGRQMVYKSCSECGSKMYEGDSSCSECGYSMEEKETRKEYALNEGDCGCGTCEGCDDGSDYSIDTMAMIDDALNTLTNTGYDVNATKKDYKVGNHKVYKGSYMAKSHLYKVNKYAEKLYHMIPDGHNLEDWMRSKLAQIADDIGEVYHALDHDKFEGDV